MKKVLFDIDHTLFDTDRLREIIEPKWPKILNTSEESFLKVRSSYVSSLASSTDFRPENYLQYLSQAFKVDTKKLRPVFFENPSFYKNSLFPDTLSTIKALSGRYLLGVFSEGSPKYQKMKLSQSGILPFFSQKHFYIFRRKIRVQALKKLPRESLVVDDSEVVVNCLYKHKVMVIWLNRKTKEKHPLVPTIHSLKDLLDLSFFENAI